ncbi:MAG: L-fucose/L-arabinose isomerase family protein [Spirochaetia bacterium]
MKRPVVAVVTLGETRDDVRRQRESLVQEEQRAVSWLQECCEPLESPVLSTLSQVRQFAETARKSDPHALIINLAVWTNPVLSVQVCSLIPLPTILLGNGRPETSSLVGMLGAGGALDQAGVPHLRVFDHRDSGERRRVGAFLRAARALKVLRGCTLGIFGGRSLGIVTAAADAAQVMRIFGVDIEPMDQAAIIERARSVPAAEVDRHVRWLRERLGEVRFGGSFTPEGLERQVRGYIATERIVAERGFDFVGVKCQPELSDGYASHCLCHMLMNGSVDADGEKPPMVHACEADVDGALTMQILQLLAGGNPASLLDIRLFDRASGVLTLANCGALPAAFAADAADPDGFSRIEMVPHSFGQGGGGALPFVASSQEVTLARLCRRRGEYWMAVMKGEIERRDPEWLARTTAEFPHAFVSVPGAQGFLAEYGSNHIHMVQGDLREELLHFCALAGIAHREWPRTRGEE